MSSAPTDGSVVRAYIYTTRRPIFVRWDGRHWNEGNGEKWDAGQLSGWDYDLNTIPCAIID
jgi:hypothetical protein